MVSSLHDWLRQLISPDLGSPISHGQEEFRMRWVSPEGVNRAVMLAGLETELCQDANRVIWSFVCKEHVTLLSSNQVLHWSSFLVILKGGGTEQLLLLFITVEGELVSDVEGFRRFSLCLLLDEAVVPPVDLAISGG